MKFLICGDFHLTDIKPENRIDDYEKIVLNKFKSILDTAEKNKISYIIQPGDFFDRPNPSYKFFSEITELIKNCKTVILAVTGQHDLRYRNLENTAIIALSKSCDNFQLLQNKVIDKINLIGVSYGEVIPEPTPDVFNILLIHKMIVAVQEAGWQGDYDLGIDFLTKSKYDLIISGDNHKSFMIKTKKRFLFNCGSLMRSTIDQIDHRPCFYIFETEDQTYKQFFIPVTIWQNTFDLKKKVKEEERNEHMESFVSGLSEHKDMGLNFADNLFMYLKKNKVDSTITDIIKRNMEE